MAINNIIKQQQKNKTNRTEMAAATASAPTNKHTRMNE
jgi:hypothetical protein